MGNCARGMLAKRPKGVGNVARHLLGKRFNAAIGESVMRRREFTKLALAGAAGTLAAPAVARAQTTFNWKMTSFYGPNAAFYSTGPGSAKDLVKRIDDMSGGRIKIQFYGAGELIPAAEGFDAVSSGTVEMNYAIPISGPARASPRSISPPFTSGSTSRDQRLVL